MKERNMTFRREELEKLSTLELDNILRTELDSDAPEREAVLLVLSILEERDPTNSASRPEGAVTTWDEFVIRTGCSENTMEKPNRKPRKWFTAVAAAAAIVLILLMTVPQTVGAESIFEIIGRWTRNLFSFSEVEEKHDNEGYVFKTDHEGLQQIYDAVVEQGVTDPVVPTWIPEGYDLKEFRVISPEEDVKVYARFVKGEEYIQFVVEIYTTDSSNKYPKDEVNATVYNSAGIQYYIVPNEDTWKAAWNHGRAECLLVTNDAEEILYQILNSIQWRSIR